MTQRRIMLGQAAHEISFKVVDEKVVAVPNKKWLWAIGHSVQRLTTWLTKKHIPWHSYGFRARKNDTLIYGDTDASSRKET